MEKSKITIGIEANTKKLELKLRAISKYTEALANELLGIDNTWICDCGSEKYEDVKIEDIVERNCTNCSEKYLV